MTYILRKGHSLLEDLANGNTARLGPGVEKIYYVNGVSWSNGFTAGNDGNSGLTMGEPLYTLKQALLNCTDEGNDAIVLLDYWNNDSTWPIAINKSLVSIYGVGSKPLWNWISIAAVGSYPCFDITGSHVYIEGISFYPHSTKGGITFDDGCMSVHINSCAFGQGTSGIDMDAADVASSVSITNCYFVATLSAGGIDVDDDPAFLFIDGNRFDRLTGDCINITSGSGHVITNNTFSLKANSQGLAITLGTGVLRAVVDGNKASYGNATTTSPYDDEGTVETNSWGLNYLGLTAITPA